MESVRTALAALVPHSRLPPRKSKALPLLLSLTSSWMETGWMTGLLLRVVSCSGVCSWEASPSSVSECGPPGACCDWVMVRQGWEVPSLKWVCSRVLMYSHTLRTEGKEGLMPRNNSSCVPKSKGSLKKCLNLYLSQKHSVSKTLRHITDSLSSYIPWPPMSSYSKQSSWGTWMAI